MSLKSAQHGQNFLTDFAYADRIINSLQIKSENILEIGPGKGILTERLIAKGIPVEQIWAVELDETLAQGIQQRWPKLHLKQGNILKTDLAALAIKPPFQLLSNLPYDISRPFFDLLLDWTDLISEAVIMVQKEFADKICLPEKKAAQGHALAASYEIERRFNVPPGAFRPSPKVMSSVLRLHTRQDSIPLQDRLSYYRFLKICFSSPRKTLFNNLRKDWQPILSQAFEAHGIQLNARPEELDSGSYMQLWRTLAGYKGSTPYR